MSNASNSLIRWYLKNNYSLPWRDSSDPYKIWISEIMLQQTQVKTVIPYYHNWMALFSNVQILSKAPVQNILKCWEGLGYYQRAHNIHETSKIIVQDFEGVIPQEYNKLISLKGIGDYTASAILSIAFKKKYPAIDGNLKRVMARLSGLANPKKIISSSKKIIMNFMHNNNPGFINQALMDLGREVCLPKNPKCIACPISKFCIAYSKNKISYYTFTKKKKKNPTYHVSVGIIWKENKILISKRKKDGLLGGLWELPGGKRKNDENDSECLSREIDEELGIAIKIKNEIGKIKHHYSHFSINLTGYTCEYFSGKAQAYSSEKIKWIKVTEIVKYPFPKATLKLFILAGLLNE
tara:strand:- start:1695 stop:2750 length:1056 start_codon:yes stop_codon:yes gene_type:complete